MEIYSTKQQKSDINLLHFKKTYDIIPVLQQMNKIYNLYARVAQLVEYDLAKVGVAGSSPVSRFFICGGSLYFKGLPLFLSVSLYTVPLLFPLMDCRYIQE